MDPLGRTRSGNFSDRLPGLLILELYGGLTFSDDPELFQPNGDRRFGRVRKLPTFYLPW